MEELAKNVVTAIKELEKVDNISLEVCGTWLWVDGDTKPNKDLIKSLGGRWAKMKQKWYIAPEGGRRFFGRRHKEQDMNAIRVGYGSELIKEN